MEHLLLFLEKQRNIIKDNKLDNKIGKDRLC